MHQTKPRWTAHPGYMAFCLDCDRWTDDVHGDSWNGAPEQAFGFLCPACMGKRCDKADAIAHKCAEFPKVARVPWWRRLELLLLLITCGGEG